MWLEAVVAKSPSSMEDSILGSSVSKATRNMVLFLVLVKLCQCFLWASLRKKRVYLERNGLR